jgi:hypothetical protein
LRGEFLNIAQSLSPTSSAYPSTQRHLRYTLDSGRKLSLQDREFYEENGFFVAKNLVSHDDIERFR